VAAGAVSSVSGTTRVRSCAHSASINRRDIGTARAPALAHHARVPRVVEHAIERGTRHGSRGRRGEFGATQPGRVGEQQEERIAVPAFRASSKSAHCCIVLCAAE
jgi:hypothetical protein